MSVRSTVEELADIPIRTDRVTAILDDKNFLNRLATAYREANRLDFDADPVLLFRWAIQAAVQGREAAIRAARSSGRAEWRYTDRIYRTEALSNLPADVDDFVRSMRQGEDDGDPGSDIEMWADALGGLGKWSTMEHISKKQGQQQPRGGGDAQLEKGSWRFRVLIRTGVGIFPASIAIPFPALTCLQITPNMSSQYL